MLRRFVRWGWAAAPGQREARSDTCNDTHSSQIDDVLLCPTLHTNVNAAADGGETQAYCSVSIAGGNFDHKPVHTRLPIGAIRLWDAKKPTAHTTQDGCNAHSKWNVVTLPAGLKCNDTCVQRKHTWMSRSHRILQDSKTTSVPRSKKSMLALRTTPPTPTIPRRQS